ncbi:MAG: 50S ribosomal protein L23 [Candidatus Eisenbacteria bacterium]
MKDARSIILKPIVTEKGSRLRETGNKYVFKVATGANRIEIKRAVEEIFHVKVKGVRTMVAHGKVKRMGMFSGKRPDWKKAVVTLETGQTIDLFEQV